MKSKIAILGNGKLTLSIVLDFIASGLKDSLVVIGRDTSNLTAFDKLGVRVSRKIEDAQEASFIFITVTPSALGEQLFRMRVLDIKFPTQVVSIVSGSNAYDIAQFLGIKQQCVIVGTATANIQYGYGLLYFGRKANIQEDLTKLFRPSNKIVFGKFKNIIKKVTAWGAMAGIDTKALILMYESLSDDLKVQCSLRQFLLLIKHHIKEQGINAYSDIHPEVNIVVDYLQRKARILREVLGYGYSAGSHISVDSFYSTVCALLEIKDLTIDALHGHILKVATKGGCTEKGLALMKTIEDLSYEKLKDIISAIHFRTSQFRKEARASIENERGRIANVKTEEVSSSLPGKFIIA